MENKVVADFAITTGRKRALWMALILAVLCMMLSGCDEGSTAHRTKSRGATPRMMLYGEDTPVVDFWYALDIRSDVVYIMGGGVDRGYMAVALNQDGSPMTRRQLEELMQESDEW